MIDATERDRRALLDTTVQLDRLKYPGRRESLHRLLEGFRLKFATSFSLVEFKATLIQECITIHNHLRKNGARFTRVRDMLLEKDHPQVSLRAHIFNNYICVFSRSAFDVSQEEDEVWAEKARLLLENHIPRLYEWLNSDEAADAILKDRLRCDRAREAPIKRSAAFSTNLPNCRRGVNKTCRVEQLIQEDGEALVERLRPYLAESEQLSRSVEVFESVIRNPRAELSVNECRRAGDCLIALEGAESATHALSSNRREWRPLSDAVGYEFVHVTYPEERTR